MWTSSGKALREPHGRVHFAGAEYSALRFGYLDGAIRSANATAALLLKALAGEGLVQLLLTVILYCCRLMCASPPHAHVAPATYHNPGPGFRRARRATILP